MKKILAIIMALCLMASLLCITAFAADAPASDVVLRVSGLKADGTTEYIKDYNNFEKGWNEAVSLAGQLKTNGHERIIVDFYADWNANGKGEFGDDDGDGFDNTTIYIPEDARITLNLRNHTINRGLTEWEWDGEVIYIDNDADVIINEGTITGGWSNNGAGGIHVKSGVNLTLNNVHIVGNTADDADGGGISIDGATLTMNGGSFDGNSIIGWTNGDCGGAVCVEDGTAVFNNVEFKNNLTGRDNSYGAAIYAEDSDVTLNGCTFEGNGLVSGKSTFYSSVIYVNDSAFAVNNCTFKNNRADAMFLLKGASLSVTSSEFTGINDTKSLFKSNKPASIYITDTNFENNKSYVVSTSGNINEDSFFRNCKFNNTKSSSGVTFLNTYSPIEFYDCDFGDCKLNGNVKVMNSTVTEDEAVIGVSGLLADGTVSFTDYYKNFENGWNAAIVLAMKNVYDRIVVDLYADWNANEGVFGDLDEGFKWDTICIPEGVRVTLNLNGKTINRGLTENEYNGEVIYIDENANVIINNGTITGGYSDNGAGGIHIKGGASVTLNDVHLLKNITDGDYGAGIAVYNGATLVMNGGSFTSNLNVSFDNGEGAAFYIKNATATFKNVSFYDNQFQIRSGFGAAVYAVRSSVTMEGCEIISNGAYGKVSEFNGHGSYSTIEAIEGSIITLKNTTIKANGSSKYRDDVQPWQTGNDLSVIRVKNGSQLFLDGCTITENISSDYIFAAFNVNVYVSNTTVTGNASSVFEGHTAEFTNCTFGNNAYGPTFDIKSTDKSVVFTDCEMGDSTFNDVGRVSIVDSARAKRFGSMFGEGSFTMIIALLALIASVASIVVNLYTKKQLAPVAANNAEEAEDEE